MFSADPDVSPGAVPLSSKHESYYLYLHLPVLAWRVTVENRLSCLVVRVHSSTSPAAAAAAPRTLVDVTRHCTIYRPSLQFDLPQNTITDFRPSTAAYVVSPLRHVC